MDIVDRHEPKHAKALAEIREFLRCPCRCRVTGRVKADLIRLRLSKGEVLDQAVCHIEAGSTIHCKVQTMYFKTERLGYIISPLMVRTQAVYFKVALPPLEKGEEPYLQILAVHEPEQG
jgi:hypothetical protein